MDSIKKQSILYCIVLFKCDLEHSKTYSSLLNDDYRSWLYIYDNSPEPHNITRPNTIYVHDKNNSGLSVAYNSASLYAKGHGFEWVLLLDQDTDFTNIRIEDYLNAISQNPNIYLFAPKVRVGSGLYMSPCVLKHKSGHLMSCVPSGIIDLEKYSIINSGMCVNVKAMIYCGGYNEKVFLDYSDIEFLDRFKKNYPTAYIINKEIIQNLSALSDDKATTINRYRLFCRSVKHCHSSVWTDKLWFLIVVARRGLSICLRNATIEPLKIFFKEYL